MIKFKAVRYKNLLSTGNKFTEIFLDNRKATLILGENGSGKSTMLDALCFGLFGKGFRKVSKNSLINSVNQRGMVVEVEFAIGSKQYRVVRGAKPNVFEIFLNDRIINQDANMRDYQEQLEKQILKLNYKTFTQVVILGSSSFTPFMQMNQTDRRGIIEDILDINIFSIMNGLLKTRMTGLKSELHDLDYEIRLSEDRIDTYKKHIKSLGDNRRQKIQDFNESVETAQSNINNLQEQCNLLLEDVGSLQNETSDSEKIKSKLTKTLELEKQLEQARTRGTKEIKFYEDNDECPTCHRDMEDDFKQEKISTTEGKISEIDKAIQDISKNVIDINKRIEEIQKIQSKVDTLNRQVAQKQNEISASNQYITKINVEIEKLKSENVTDDSEKLNKELKILKGQNTEKEGLIDKRSYYDIAALLLQDSGIKTKIIRQYLPIMNKLINKYLASMDFFVQFNLDEGFNESIKSRYRDAFSYANFSEGEKMRIDLALLFTWRAVAKLKNSVNTNLLVLDEVFDSSLDEGGTDEFLKILHTLDGDTNTFIISHKGDILTEKFRHTMTFEKVKNFSRVQNSK